MRVSEGGFVQITVPFVLALAVVSAYGCGGSDTPAPASDAATTDASTADAGASDAGGDCRTDADCDDGESCNGAESCAPDRTCIAGAPLPDTTACPDGRCRAAVCAPPSCGDGGLDAGEECDDANTTPADGCEADCTFTCTTDSECADGDPCNGDESCRLTDNVCTPGAAPACDDGNRCTADACDPAVGCASALIDEDGDGHAPSSLGICGDDCNDLREDVYPGAAELCDAIDQDCDGDPAPSSVPIWFLDCDRDGYAVTGAPSARQCAEPAPGPCGGGWTTRVPLGGEVDCDDLRDDVSPGDPEVPGDAADADEDCDGAIECFADGDGDGARSMAIVMSPDRACTPAGEARASAPLDCDDTDAAIRPGAAEQPGDVADADENCDGVIACFADADGDSFRAGAIVSPDASCDGPGEVRVTTAPGDCDDSRAAIHPSAAESCDGVDEDCDGAIDEGELRCGVGACAVTVPACMGGVMQTCTPGTPGAESCNGVDDDCDATTDEGLPDLSCGVGACARTVPSCAGGTPQPCVPGAPVAESCNGIDDSCEGEVDEGLGSQSCGMGRCRVMVPVCASGMLQPCTPLDPAPETCNGMDDNCDGATDEGNPGGDAPCTVPGLLGVCASGATFCASGMLACRQTVMAGTETCSGADEDCDGSIDEGNPGGGGSCTVTGTMGECAPGTITCISGTLTCRSLSGPMPEGCNGRDDDCNGVVDDGDPGGGAPCSAGGAIGECARGTTQCVSGMVACQPRSPVAETCNGLDDDCNGTIDNGFTTTWCRDADGDAHGNGADRVTACTPPAGYVAACSDCNDSNSTVHPGATETCNGIDDNCSGAVDEGVTIVCYADADDDTYARSTASAQNRCPDPLRPAVGNCPVGTTNRVPDVFVNDCNDANAAIRPGAPEVCNNVDDNCQGAADEGFECRQTSTESCTSCGYTGTRVCSATCSWGACRGFSVNLFYDNVVTSFTHACGFDCGAGDWCILGAASPGCDIVSGGPGLVVPTGRYEAEFSFGDIGTFDFYVYADGALVGSVTGYVNGSSSFPRVLVPFTIASGCPTITVRLHGRTGARIRLYSITLRRIGD